MRPTIVCVLRSMPHSEYSDTWVRKLAQGVNQYTSGEYRFVCLSDHIVSGVETLALKHPDWPGKGWWSKLELFRPNLLSGPVIYLDLDMLVTGDITNLLSETGQLTAPRNYGARDFCSTAMAFDPSIYGFLYQEFALDPDCFVSKFDKFTALGIGDQAYIANSMRKRGLDWQYFEDHLVPSYKLHCLNKNTPTPDSVAVAFHGRPKMNHLDNWAGAAWKALKDEPIY